MCGIWGICYGPEGPEAEEWTPDEFAQILFPASVHRGPHAWGWMTWDGEEIEIYKQVGKSDSLTAIRNMNLQPNPKWIVGHVRYATHGSPSNMINNHPIQHGKIIGVHNGVLRNHESILAKTGREDDECEVDSEAIFAAINKWGHVPGLRKIDGAMVTVYVNKENPEILRIGRSVGRSLYLSKTEAGSLIFASEPEIIDATGIKCTEPSPVSANRLLTIREGSIRKRQTYREIPTALEPAPAKKFKMAKPHRFSVDESAQAPTKKRSRKGRRNMHAGAPAEKPFAERSGPVLSRHLQDGDTFGDMYWYQGVFMTKGEFEATILAERES